MSFITRFFDGLAEAESDDVMSIMSSIYGPFLHISLIFPVYDPSWRALTVFHVVFAFVVYTFQCSLLIITTWIERDDLELASLVFHYAIIMVFCMTVLFAMNFHRKLNSVNHGTLSLSWGKYRPDNVYEEVAVKKMQKVLHKEFLMFLLIPGGVSLAAGAALVIPYIWHYNERRVTKNGVNRNLLIPCYYPFPTEFGWWHGFTLLLQVTTVGLIAILVVSLLLTFIRVAQRVQLEFRVATYAVQTVFSRAAKLYKKTFSSNDISKIDYMNDNYQHCVGICLRDVVIHHHTIVDLAGRFDSISCWPLALAFLLGTGVIGLSLVNILSALNAGNYENVGIFSLLLVGEVANIFTVCVIGEAITTDSETFHEELYHIEWYKLNSPNKRTLLNLQVGSHQPYVMVAAGLVASNHDTFSSIMNSAYSFFNLLNVS